MSDVKKNTKGTPLSEILNSYGFGSDRSKLYITTDKTRDIDQVYDLSSSIKTQIRQDSEVIKQIYTLPYLGRNLPRGVSSDDEFDFSSSEGEGENSDEFCREDTNNNFSLKATAFDYNENVGFTKILEPKTRRRFSFTLMTRPLLVNNSTILQRERFKNLLAGALTHKLPEIENLKFLEQFRYAFVISQLLDERTTSRKADNNLDNANKFNNAKTKIDLCDDKFWVSGGGCIVVVSLLLHWSIKSGRFRSSKKKELGMLVLVLCIVCFLFAHSRKKLLRLLRKHAMLKSTRFMKYSQEFDHSITKCLRIIQEVELFSRGYRPDLTNYNFQTPYPNLIPPISRIERQNDTKLCKHLRSTLSSTLYLSIINLLTGVKILRTLCIDTDLERYLDIYDVNLSDLDFFTLEDLEENKNKSTGAGAGAALGNTYTSNDKRKSFAFFNSGDMDFGFDNNLNNFERSFQAKSSLFHGSIGANMSIKDLRCYFHKMHLIRRIFVCCLLSMSADKNDYQEFKQWKCVVANLDKSSTLMKNLSESILDTIYLMESNNEHTDHNINKNANSQKCSKSKIKWKSHLKSLDNISFSLRHIEARMQIAKEESIRITKMLNINATCSEKQLSPLEKEPFISDDSDQHTVMKNYNEIGKELKSLLEAWEMGKSELQNALDPNTLGESIKMPVAKISEENIFKQDLEQPMTPNEMEDGSVVSNATTYIDDYFGSTGDTKMTILEAIADDDFKKRNDLKGLSRMQRIHKVKEMRSKESERRAESEKHNRLLLELKNVLETNRHC